MAAHHQSGDQFLLPPLFWFIEALCNQAVVSLTEPNILMTQNKAFIIVNYINHLYKDVQESDVYNEGAVRGAAFIQKPTQRAQSQSHTHQSHTHHTHQSHQSHTHQYHTHISHTHQSHTHTSITHTSISHTPITHISITQHINHTYIHTSLTYIDHIPVHINHTHTYINHTH